MACPFCQITEEQERILEARERVYVIFSNPRLTEGHLLVIPKRHVEKISQLEPLERKELWATVVGYQERVLETLADGCDIRQNYRPYLSESRFKVHHLHVHLLPRSFEDDIYKEYGRYQDGLFEDLSSEEIVRLRKILS